MLTIIPQRQVRADGTGSVIKLGEYRGKLLVLTLEISSVIEQESICVAVYGSSDGIDWGNMPLVSFPQKHYCGLYSILLNLTRHSDVRYLRTEWTVKGWFRAEVTPMFQFTLYAEPSGARLSAVAVAR